MPEDIFPINLELIVQHNQKELSLKDKYKIGTYHKVSFCGRSNIQLNLIMCKDNIIIPSILQSYILHWYHIYRLHPVIDRMEAIIHQHFYWLGIRDTIRKEVTNCDTCQSKKQ